MSDHEDDYIDYVARHKSGFLGGMPEDGLEHLRDLRIVENALFYRYGATDEFTSGAFERNLRYNSNMKLSFTMTPHAEQPKHSTRFNFESFNSTTSSGAAFQELEKFKPSFYIPKPVAAGAKRIRVTIEVVD